MKVRSFAWLLISIVTLGLAELKALSTDKSQIACRSLASHLELTGDLLPHRFDSSGLITAAIHQLRAGPDQFDRVTFYISDSGQLEGVAWTSPQTVWGSHSDSVVKDTLPLFSRSEVVHVLAWQEVKYRSTAGFQKALCLAKFIDTLNNQVWALMYMERAFNLIPKSRRDYEFWRMAYSDLDSGRHAIQLLDHLPTNTEIYALLSLWKDIQGGFMQFNPKTRKDSDGFKFIDGAVRKNTWKSVIGEAPTKFFPNGK